MLHDQDRGQHENDSEGLNGAQNFSEQQRGEQDGEYGLKATGDDGTRGLEVLQSEEVKRKSPEHGEYREYEKKEPLRRGVVGRDDFPRRVDEEPEGGGGGEGPGEHAPAVVTGEDAVSGNVVEGEGK